MEKTINKKTDNNVIVNAIRNFISVAPGGMDFPQIEAMFKTFNFNYEGCTAFFASHNPSVVLWMGWNDEAIDLLEEVLDDENYYVVPCPAYLYNLKGYSFPFPVIDKGPKYLYREIHWSPARVIDKRLYLDDEAEL